MAPETLAPEPDITPEEALDAVLPASALEDIGAALADASNPGDPDPALTPEQRGKLKDERSSEYKVVVGVTVTRKPGKTTVLKALRPELVEVLDPKAMEKKNAEKKPQFHGVTDRLKYYGFLRMLSGRVRAAVGIVLTLSGLGGLLGTTKTGKEVTAFGLNKVEQGADWLGRKAHKAARAVDPRNE